MRDFCPGGFPTSGSPGSNSSRHRYSCRRDTPNSLVRATMLSQPFIRSTATCRKCSEYRLFATRSSFPAKCVFILLSHFWGSLQRFVFTRVDRRAHDLQFRMLVVHCRFDIPMSHRPHDRGQIPGSHKHPTAVVMARTVQDELLWKASFSSGFAEQATDRSEMPGCG